MLSIHNKRAYRTQLKRNIANILQCLHTIGGPIDLVQLHNEFAIYRRRDNIAVDGNRIAKIDLQITEKNSGMTLPTSDQH